MKLSRFVGIGVVLLLLPACSSVMVEQPIGDIPLVLDSEDWEGAWLLDGDLYMVQIVDSERGELRIAAIETTTDGDFALETMTLLLRDGGEWILGNLRDDDWEESGFALAVGKLQDDQLLILLPDVAKFRTLVEAGTLPGRLEGDSVLLESLDAEQIALILSDEYGFLFDLDEGIGVATRISR